MRSGPTLRDLMKQNSDAAVRSALNEREHLLGRRRRIETRLANLDCFERVYREIAAQIGVPLES